MAMAWSLFIAIPPRCREWRRCETADSPLPQVANLAKGEGADQLVGAAVAEEGLQLKRTLLAEVLLTTGAVVDLEALRCPVPAQFSASSMAWAVGLCGALSRVRML